MCINIFNLSYDWVVELLHYLPLRLDNNNSFIDKTDCITVQNKHRLSTIRLDFIYNEKIVLNSIENCMKNLIEQK
jgi:hypothetical protein